MIVLCHVLQWFDQERLLLPNWRSSYSIIFFNFCLGQTPYLLIDMINFCVAIVGSLLI